MTTITLHIDHAEGSLQRLIGLVERRGFQIEGMHLADEGQHRALRLSVRARDNGRCPQVLGRQIDRLIGVRRIAAAGAAAHVQEAEPCPV